MCLNMRPIWSSAYSHWRTRTVCKCIGRRVRGHSVRYYIIRHRAQQSLIGSTSFCTTQWSHHTCCLFAPDSYISKTAFTTKLTANSRLTRHATNATTTNLSNRSCSSVLVNTCSLTERKCKWLSPLFSKRTINKIDVESCFPFQNNTWNVKSNHTSCFWDPLQRLTDIRTPNNDALQ